MMRPPDLPLPSHRIKPLRGLFVVVLGFLALTYGIAAAWQWSDARSNAEDQLRYIGGMLAHNTQSTLKNYELVLKSTGNALLAAGALDAPARGRALIDRMEAIDPGMAGFGLARPDGQLLLVSGVAPGVALPNLTRQPVTRDSFLQSVSSGRLQIGRPYRMALLEQWVIPLRAPLTDADGRTVAVMTAGYPLDRARTLLAGATLPTAVTISLLRADGHLQYRYPPPAGTPQVQHADYVDPAPLLGATQLAAMPPGSGVMAVDSARGDGPSLLAYERIDDYGLFAVAALPQARVFDDWLGRMIFPTVLLAVLLLGAHLAYRLALARQAAADDALSRLAHWRQAVLDAADYSIISTDTAGTIVSFNAGAERMLGYRAAEVVGQASPAIFHDRHEISHRAAELATELGETVEPGFEVFVARARRGADDEREWTYVRKNGSRFPVHLSVTSLRGPGGEIEGFLGIAADRSDHKRAQRELIESQQALLERNESLRLINRLSNRIHASLELDDILREALDALMGLSQAPSVAIYLFDPESGALTLAASRNNSGCTLRFSPAIPLDGSLCGLAVTRKCPQLSEDFAHDARIRPDLRELLAAANIHAGASIPLVYNDQALGGLNVMFGERQAFSPSELNTFSALANTIALAIANARHVVSLAFQASHDSLTTLPNRSVLHAEFAGRVAREPARRAALLLLDLDRFKEVNDTLGHHVGDALLMQIGPRIRQGLGECEALVCRLGGDEFAILLTGLAAHAEAADLARTINLALQQPFTIQEVALQIGASIGVAFHPLHGSSSHDLLRVADVAMYQAKKLGTGVAVYSRDFDSYSPERLALAAELAHAVDHGELVLHYQPKFDIASRRVTGFEALVRWRNPRLGLLYPASFIHLAEMNEVIHPFSRAILDLALADKARLHALGHRQPVAINLSARNLLDGRFIAHLQETIAAGHIPYREIELELTETTLMQDPDSAVALLRRVADLGVAISVDDFGTGYSSLAYLRRLPLSALKIDRSFVTAMRESTQDAIIVRSTVALAHNLGLRVIAEGVEDAETLDALHEMGCDQAQGYYLGRPLPLDELLALLEQPALADA